MRTSLFNDVIWEFICVRRTPREMLCQHVADDCDRSAETFGKFMLAEAMVHRSNDALPEFIPAFFMNRFIANDSEFVNTRRHKNEHRIAFARLVHTQPVKLFLRRDKRITV